MLFRSWTTIDSTSVTYSGANTYVIMPQSAIGNSLIVKDVVIAKGESVIFSGDLNKYTIKSGDIPAISGNTQSADNFIMNSHYLISLEISSSSKDSADNSIFGDAILFSTTTLVDWDSINTTIIQP